MVKKALCICMCALMVLATVSFCIAAKEEEPFSAIVASDLHYDPTPAVAPNRFPGEKYYCVDDSTIMLAISRAIIKQWLRQAAELDSPFVLLCGDLVDSGYVSAHQQMAKLLSDFEKQSGKKVYVINGNHDFNAGISLAQFRSLYKDFGYSEALVKDDKTCSYTADLTDAYRLIAVDSCNHIDGNDGITDALLEWVGTQVQAAKADGKEPVVIMHHNFLNHLAMQSTLLPKYIIRPELNMKDRFTEWGVRYVFTGHQHGQDIASYTDKNGKVVYDIMTTALTSYPCAFRTVEQTSAGMDVRSYTVDTLDLNDIPQSGYTQELKDEMVNDLNTFAKGMFMQSFDERKEGFLNEEVLGKVFNKLGGEKMKNSMMPYVPQLFSYAKMPIYKEDAGDGTSLEALAEARGLTLPKTEFKESFDIVFHVIASYYAGDENIPNDDPAVVLGVRCLYVIMAELMKDINRSSKEALLEDIKNNIGTAAAPFAVSALAGAALDSMGDEQVLDITVLLASPLIDLFGQDSTVADNDVFLPNADAPAETTLSHMQTIVARVIALLLRYLRGIRLILAKH